MALITGTSGNDSLTGTTGDDTLIGGAGDDLLEGGDGKDSLDAGDGNDVLDGVNGVDTLVGGGGDDYYVDNVVSNGSGGYRLQDVLWESAGQGVDTLEVVVDPFVVTLSSYFTVVLPEYFENLLLYDGTGGPNDVSWRLNATGNELANRIVGNAAANVLDGGAGDDLLEGHGGADTLTGGGGDDTLDGGSGSNMAVYDGNLSAYTLSVTALGYAVTGPDGTDELVSIETLQFADTTFALNRLIVGTGGDDTLVGGNLNDLLLGGAGNDTLRGNDGDDTLDGGPGADRMEGGNGNDTYYVDNEGDVVVETTNGQTLSLESAADRFVSPNVLAGFTDTVIAAVDYSLGTFVENLTLGAGSGAETGVGNELDNVLIGNSLNNALTGLDGDDTLDGGEGVDTAVFNGNSSLYMIGDAGSGASGPEGDDTLTSIERLQFSDKKLAFDLDGGEAAGNAVRIIGSVFDAPAITQHPNWVGTGLDLFDSEMSMQQVCDLVVGLLGLSNTDFVTTVYTNVVGVAPAQGQLDQYVGLLQGSGGTMTQGELLVLAANAGVNATNIDLVGLQQSGVEFA